MTTQDEQQFNVFIAGINTSLGCLLALELSNFDNVSLTGMRLKSNNQKESEESKFLNGINIKLFDGDITKEDTYKSYLKDINVIVCVLEDEKEFILNGQKKLYENGLKYGKLNKFFPSEFTCDYNNIPKEESDGLSWKKDFTEWIDSKKDNVKPVHILTGYTYQNLWNDFDIIDDTSKPIKFKYYGDKDQHFDLTDEHDISKVIVEAIFDEDVPNKLAISGDSISSSKFVEAYTNNYGKDSIVLERKGSIEDLENEIKKIRNSKYKDMSMLTSYSYQLSMFKPMRGKLINLRNSRYPNIHYTTIDRYFQRKKFSGG